MQCRDDARVDSHEQDQEPVVHSGVVISIEDGKQNQACGTGNGKNDRSDGAELVEDALVGHKLARMAQPSLRQESEIQEDDSHSATGDEERFQPESAHVGNVPARRVSDFFFF